MNPWFQMRSSLNLNPSGAMEYEQHTALTHLGQGSGPLHTAIISGETALSSLCFQLRQFLSTLENVQATEPEEECIGPVTGVGTLANTPLLPKLENIINVWNPVPFIKSSIHLGQISWTPVRFSQPNPIPFSSQKIMPLYLKMVSSSGSCYIVSPILPILCLHPTFWRHSGHR